MKTKSKRKNAAEQETSSHREQRLVYPSEEVLPDDHPVHWDYAYVVDGCPKLSPLGGGATVRDLKREWKCDEIRRCDLAARGFLG